jgi:ABC-type glycerol-3-phosphate transport system substrate-binding protein
MTRFQTIFTGILILAAVGGAILFAVARGNNSTDAVRVVMWGTLDRDKVSNFLGEANSKYRDSVNVSYVEKSPALFESELIAALARGQGPDMVLLPQDLIVKQMDKLYVVPFESYSERLFKDSFNEEGELYLSSTGILGFPFSVDPMVMYWNRDIFSDAGVSLPPTSWTELYSLAPKIIIKDQNSNILQSLVAFGSMPNVSHAKDMVALLSIQAGTPIVGYSSNGGLKSTLSDAVGGGLVPAEQAVNFFTEFSNPVKPAYSWNRSLPNDKAAFVGGTLALYFGYASELGSIRAANPNLNFDVAAVPQVSGKKATFGAMNAIALLRSSPNVAAAFTAAVTLTSAPLQTAWVATSGMPPVRRDMLTTRPSDAAGSVFYQSALMSRAWLDPFREATDDIFKRMVENVTSGKSRTSESVRAASSELDSLLR